MNVHKNASMTPEGQAHLIREIDRIGLKPAAAAAGLSTRTGRKWQRGSAQGDAVELLDSSSRPRSSPQRSCPSKVERSVALRHTLGRDQTTGLAGGIAVRASASACCWPMRRYAMHALMRALSSGGHFVGELARARNARIIRSAVHGVLAQRGLDPAEVGPWCMPEEEEYRHVLEADGFRVASIYLFERPVVTDYPISGWIQTFDSSYLIVLLPKDRPAFFEEITQALRPHLQRPDGRCAVDYTRLRFARLRSSLR